MADIAVERAKARQRRDVTINLRAPAPAREMIDRAAEALGKTRSEFILDSAQRRAEDVLLDQRYFMLDERRYEDFMRVLASPPKPVRALRTLLAHKAPWEK